MGGCKLCRKETCFGGCPGRELRRGAVVELCGESSGLWKEQVNGGFYEGCLGSDSLFLLRSSFVGFGKAKGTGLS